MITIAQAMTHRGELWHMSITNADGTPMRCRITGKCQTWKTRPGEFKLPVKHGLKECFYITQDNAHDWCLPKLWPAEHQLFAGIGDTPKARARKQLLERAHKAYMFNPTPAVGSTIKKLAHS